MKRYDLFIEHGPMRKKTFVHVPGLMGCIAQGPTTDEALEATPNAIRGYARFLASHGERIVPEARFTVRIAEEITQDVWLGNGAAQISDDRKPLKASEVGALLDRYSWIREETLGLLEAMPSNALRRKPSRGRALEQILLHVMGAEASYVSTGLGVDRELNRAWRAAEKGELEPREAMVEAARRLDHRLRAATPAQLRAVIPHGKRFGSARRTIRRALEHGWEHYLEIRDRLGAEPLRR